MKEERLTPQLGRLIDEAKSAAFRAGPAGARSEAVALLGENGAVYVACRSLDAAIGSRPAEIPEGEGAAADAAAASARLAGCARIMAAAVAISNDPNDTLPPSEGSRRALAGIDPDLPLVFKHKGRWIMLLLSELPVQG